MRTSSVVSVLSALFIVLLLVTPALGPSYSSSNSLAVGAGSLDYKQVASRIEEVAILKHVETLQSFGSRVTGYPGCNKASEYILERFKEYGLKSMSLWPNYTHTYPIVVPMDYGAKISVLTPEQREIPAYPFWPNLVTTGSTPPGGVEGLLIDAGQGELQDFDGKPVDGSIVLMDFESHRRWLNAPDLGAQAVIFVESDKVSRYEANLKTLGSVPFNFPRLYISAEDGRYLRSLLKRGEVKVRIQSQMKWESIQAKNIIGYIPGKNYQDQYILITAHYDGFSYVPSMAPAASEAIGISVLLELAKFYGRPENQPRYTMVFVAFSGTDLGLYGSRWFVHQYVSRDEGWESFGKNIAVQYDIDLHTETDEIGLATIGAFSTNTAPGVPQESLIKYVHDVITPQITSQLGVTFRIEREISGSSFVHPPAGWFRIVSSFHPTFNSEPLMNINGPALALCTIDSHRVYWGTPHDTIDRLEKVRLKPQLQWVYCVIEATDNLDTMIPSYVVRWSRRYAMDTGPKYVDISGTVSQYSFEISWHEPVPDALLAIRIPGGFWSLWSYLPWTGLSLYTFSDKSGNVFVPALSQSWRSNPYQLRAFVVNSTTGNVEYAPDFGKYSFLGRLNFESVKHPDSFGFTDLMKCGSVVFFDIGDPNILNGPTDNSLEFAVYDIRSHSSPEKFGFASQWFGDDGSGIAMFFLEPEVPHEILMTASYAMRYPLAVLLNSTAEKTEGSGYAAKAGQQVTIKNSALCFAENFYHLNHERIERLLSLGVQAPYIPAHQKTKKLIDEAHDALRDRNYSKAFYLSNEAWRNERKVYLDLRIGAEDSINTLPFFGMMLVLFALLAERLFFARSGMKRIGVVLACYGLPMALLYVFHQGSLLASNSFMLLINVGAVILITPILIMVFSSFLDMVKRLRRKALGVHAVELSRTTVFTLSFSMGTENMRKRSIRSALVLVTVILMVSSLTSFTSLSSISLLTPIPFRGVANYDGINLHHELWASCGMSWGQTGIGERIAEDLRGAYGDAVLVSPAAWFAQMPNPTIFTFTVEGPTGQTYKISAYLGLTPEEKNVSGVDKLLVDGRWFEWYDWDSCIISSSLAKLIGNVKPHSVIRVNGLNLTLIGIIGDQALDNFVDLDQERITPLDYGIPGFRDHLSAVHVVIVPYDYCLSLGGWTMGVRAVFKDPAMILEAAKNVYTRYGFPTFASVKSQNYIVTSKGVVTLHGVESQIVPVIMVALILLNTMLANVTERKPEISTLSSLGLSPFHITVLFLAEAAVSAIVGGLFGYCLGVVAMRSLSPMAIGLAAPNYSSSWVVSSMAFAISLTVASTLYPMFLSSKMVTPSLERKWRLPKPKGDDWPIPLPFIMSKAEEVEGMIAYLKELIDAHRSEQAESFSVRDCKFKISEATGVVQTEVSLHPYELGVRQECTLTVTYNEADRRYYWNLHIHRNSGARSSWERQNKVFIDLLRKQFLLWGGLASSEREAYAKRFVKEVGKES